MLSVRSCSQAIAVLRQNAIVRFVRLSSSTAALPALPSTVARDLRQISAADILPTDKYAELRKQYRALRTQAKQSRRVEVGFFLVPCSIATQLF
jgi:hypothetical protein